MRGGVALFFLFMAFAMALLVAIFAQQNMVPVTVTFFLWQLETTLVMIIVGSAFVGAFISLMLAAYKHFVQYRVLRKTEQRLEQLEAELSSLHKKAEAQELKKTESEQDLKKAETASV